jgi:sterol desaturase/sphingolipid hydroxylase (fatty acid hydroxylase superfamily)
MQIAARLFAGVPWLALTVLAALTLAERRWPARWERAPRVLNLSIFGVLTILQRTAVPIFMGAVSAAALRRGVPSLHIGRWPIWLSAPLLLVSLDFCEYLYHRAQHAIPWLWRRHALHHSDPCMNATTAERHWWGDFLLKAILFNAPLAVLLQPGALDYGIYALISFYNLFTHANLRVNFGRWSWVLNSPAYHRLHHAREARFYGANYAALFPIFDVVLGSYRRPSEYVETGQDREPRSILEALAWPSGGQASAPSHTAPSEPTLA